MFTPCAPRLLIAHLKALSGRTWTLIVAKWRSFRPWLAVSMLWCFAIGSLALWAGSIYSLIATGGFAGITCWQGMGIWYLFYVNRTTSKRLGDSKLEPRMRRRLTWAWEIVAANIFFNAVSIGLILLNLVTGRLKWTDWDTRAFIAAGVVTALVFIVGWVLEVKVLDSAWGVFFLVLATRIVPQSFLAFSASLALINWLVLGGLLLVALQRAIISMIEFAEAVAAHLRKSSEISAWQLSFADLLNFGAALFPAASKVVRFS